MDIATIQRLNTLNRDFYRLTAGEFDQTRGTAWPGWHHLLPYLSVGESLSVLDLGCGNGRFGLFLAENISVPVHYHGMDNNPRLLAIARQTLTRMTNITVRFTEQDIIEQPPDSGQYDLVALFGVMHHIPGMTNRQAVIRQLARRVKPGGRLAFACWRFYEYARFRERIVPWPAGYTVEQHDYLLDWRRGERALRYCHYVDDDEHQQLITASGLRHLATYRADGQTGDMNCYSVLAFEEHSS